MPIILNPNREKSLLRRHPWIFTGAIHHVDNDPASGSTMTCSRPKAFSRSCFLFPAITNRARVWTFNDEPVDKEFFRKRIRRQSICDIHIR